MVTMAVGVSGCLGGGDQEPAPSPPPYPRSPDRALVDAAPPFSLFLCTDGYRLQSDINVTGVDLCNHRVTKPLLDPNVFDVVGQHGPANEVSIAVNPLNPLEVAGGGKDYTVSYISDVAQCGQYTVWMGTYWSRDGGITWGNDLMRGFPGDPRASPLQGNWCNTDPVLVYDDDGTLFYSGLNYDGARDDTQTADSPFSPHDSFSGSQLYFGVSRDGGETFPVISFASFGDDGVIFNDKQWFAVQPRGDHVIATWSQFVTIQDPLGVGPAVGDDVIAYVESLDGGLTWLQQKVFRPGGGPDHVGLPAAGQFSMPQYLPPSQAADLAVIWWDGDAVLYAEGIVTPAGSEFTPILSTFPVNSLKSGSGRDGTGPSQFRLSTYPVLAVDTSGGPCDGRRYVAWPDQPGSLDSDVQVLLRWSDDGLSWSNPITVNDVEQGDQLMPWIDVDPEGGVHVVWYDRRNDPDNRLLDVYYAHSDDCGASFYPNVRVSEVNVDGDLAHHQSGAPFIGDYIGLDTTPTSAHIMWADTRHTGEPGREAGSDVYAATILKDLGAREAFDAVFAEPSPTT